MLIKKSAGEKSTKKGFKYFSEGYIQDLRGHIKKVSEATSTYTFCTCPMGLAGSRGHIVGLLYQLAKYKMLGQIALPKDIAKTSQSGTKLVEFLSRYNPL